MRGPLDNLNAQSAHFQRDLAPNPGSSKRSDLFARSKFNAIFLFNIIWQEVNMEFEDWLVSEGLSPATVKKYAGAIDGPLTEWAMEHKITSKSIRQVNDPQEFGALSELIEGTEIFAERNLRGNRMYGAALNNYARYLTHIVDISAGPATAGPFDDLLVSIKGSESELDSFEPNSEEDGRKRVLQGVVRRQGQRRFRASLIAAYEGRCAITHCPVLVILEAAHVTPYLGPQTNSIKNGLLLRADIHTLWDVGLIAIEPNSMTVSVSPALQDVSYQALAGVQVFQPVATASRVSHPALAQQWAIFQAHLANVA
jgi:hypothetical protein